MSSFKEFATSMLWTNLLAVGIVLTVLVIALVIDFKFNSYKSITSKKIAMIAVFISLMVILDTISTFAFSFLPRNIEVRLGDVMLLLPGIFFGPTLGILSALLADTVNVMSSGHVAGYHFGFSAEMGLIGFVGGIIFLIANKKNWWWVLILLFALDFMVNEFLLTPIWLCALGWVKYPVWHFGLITIGAISFSAKMPVWFIFFFPCFMISYNYLNKSFEKQLWCNRKGEDLKIFDFRLAWNKWKNHRLNKKNKISTEVK